MSRPRRDPRAEAARRTVPGGDRPRSTIEAAPPAAAVAAGVPVGPGGRPRRDPRAEIAALVVPAPRRRIDRSLAAGVAAAAASAVSGAGLGVHGLASGAAAAATDRVGAAAASSSSAAAAVASPAVRTIVAPACLVLVVPDAPGGRAGAHDRQLLGAARLLADAGGGAVVVLADGGAWGGAGADRVLSLTGEGSDSVNKIATQPSPLAGEVGGAAVGRGGPRGRAAGRLLARHDCRVCRSPPPYPPPRGGRGATR